MLKIKFLIFQNIIVFNYIFDQINATLVEIRVIFIYIISNIFYSE